jgi:hypothetical protein
VTGSAADLVVRVHGQDLNVLRGKAEEVRRLLAEAVGTAFGARIVVRLPAAEPSASR